METLFEDIKEVSPSHLSCAPRYPKYVPGNVPEYGLCCIKNLNDNLKNEEQIKKKKFTRNFQVSLDPELTSWDLEALQLVPKFSNFSEGLL